MRDAKNGKEFVTEVERAAASGPHHLRRGGGAMSALGVLSGVPEADGLMGDLGGGSLELVALNNGKIARTRPCRSARALGRSTEDDLYAARSHRQSARRSRLARGGAGPHLLSGGRGLAHPRPHPHGPDALSAPRDPPIPHRPPPGGRSRAHPRPPQQAQPDLAPRHLQAAPRHPAVRRPHI